MAYKYKHFIPQNIAPSGAKQISVYDSNGSKVCTIPLGVLTPPAKEKLYSFGLLADIHLWSTNTSAYSNSNTKFDNALSYMENKNCAFCVVSGDLTITGLYISVDDTVANAKLDEGQFAAYKEMCDKHAIPVYELMGNHESYYNMAIANNLDKMETYMGNSHLSYTIERGNDLFILCGQPYATAVMSDADFTWLGETLESNKDKRCFVFVHAYIEEDSGDPMDARENSIFEYWGATKTKAFINLLNQYPNVILFHGHSHTKLECQEMDVNANYTERNGFKSVHVPSSASPRDVVFDEATKKYKSQDDKTASQGYIVDVYDDCIVLNGIDFINNTPISLGVYKIDT